MLYLITTKNGVFISMGENKGEAQINFSITFPNEKIRCIEELEDKAVHISGLGFWSET